MNSWGSKSTTKHFFQTFLGTKFLMLILGKLILEIYFDSMKQTPVITFKKNTCEFYFIFAK